MTAAGSTAPWYPGFKTAIFALLACNTAYYVFAGSLSEALDATAWLTLLALFELETGGVMRWRAGRAATAIRGVRIAALLAVGGAAAGYVYHHEWLDALNTGLWIAVIVLLEIEVRHAGAVAARRTWFALAAALLYTGLAVLVPVWAWRGEWLNAYDAALWLTAFAMIEMDVLRARAGEPPASPA